MQNQFILKARYDLINIMDCLLLNASGMPVSVMPLSTITWQDAVKIMVLGKADVILWHENWTIHSSNWETNVPSVLILREYMKPKNTVRFNRASLYVRDEGKCQYCDTTLNYKTATIDHVIPSSKGGKTNWTNCALSCGPCNSKKGDKQGFKPKTTPYKPDYFELVNKRMKFEFNVKHKEWLEFIR